MMIKCVFFDAGLMRNHRALRKQKQRNHRDYQVRVQAVGDSGQSHVFSVYTLTRPGTRVGTAMTNTTLLTDEKIDRLIHTTPGALMTAPYTGSCLCGTLRYSIEAFQPNIAHCHCSMCRKFHGAAYATIAGVDADKFRWTQGVNMLKEYTAPNGTKRGFCAHCGSSMTFYSPRAPVGVMEIALGTLDSHVDVHPDAHIYVGFKAHWSALCDGLPQFAQGRDSERLK